MLPLSSSEEVDIVSIKAGEFEEWACEELVEVVARREAGSLLEKQVRQTFHA